MGYLHRDIKSGNIVLGEVGSRLIDGVKSRYERVLKVVDFGLSRGIVLPPKPMTKEISTLNWRPPEVIMNNLRYTQALDMWSIGVVIYEMLTGSVPFPGCSEMEVLVNIFRRKGCPTDMQA